MISKSNVIINQRHSTQTETEISCWPAINVRKYCVLEAARAVLNMTREREKCEHSNIIGCYSLSVKIPRPVGL